MCAVQVFVLAGPAGSGRSSLARQLLQDFKGKLAPVALLTNRCAACISMVQQAESCWACS